MSSVASRVVPLSAGRRAGRLLLLLAAGLSLHAQQPPDTGYAPQPQGPPAPPGAQQQPGPQPANVVNPGAVGKIKGDTKNMSWAAEDRPVPRSQVPGQVQIYDQDDIVRSGARTLGEFLSQELPAQFQAQGGPGLPVNAYQNGARPQDTVVTLDGVRITDPSSVGTDLNSIPLVGVVRIEVLNGTQSARLGPGSQGGVVALFSGSDPGKGSNGDLSGLGGTRASSQAKVLPNFGWGSGWVRVGTVAAKEDQATDTADNYRLSSTFITVGQELTDTLGVTVGFRNTYQGTPNPYQDATELQRTYDPTRQDTERMTSALLGFHFKLGPGFSADMAVSHSNFDRNAPDPGQSEPLPSTGTLTTLEGGLNFDHGIFGVSLNSDIGREKADMSAPVQGSDEALATHGGFGIETRITPIPWIRFITNVRLGFDSSRLDLASGGPAYTHSQSNLSYRAALNFELGFGFRTYFGAGVGYSAPPLPEAIWNANNGGVILGNERNNFTMAGLGFGKGVLFGRMEASQSGYTHAVGFNGLTYTNQDSFRVRSVETTIGVKLPVGFGVEGFVRSQQAKDSDPGPVGPYQTNNVQHRPFSSAGIKFTWSGARWHTDLRYRDVGHQYQWLGDYTCGNLTPNIQNLKIVYRTMDATVSATLGKHWTLIWRGQNLLQPKIDVQQWLAKYPDLVNDAYRTYGYPVPPPTAQMEVSFHY